MKFIMFVLEKVFKYKILDRTKVEVGIVDGVDNSSLTLNHIYNGMISKKFRKKPKKMNVISALNAYHFKETGGKIRYVEDLKNCYKHPEKVFREMDFDGVALKPAKTD